MHAQSSTKTSEPVTTVGDVLSWLIHWKLFVFLGVVKASIASTQQELHQLCALHLAHTTAPSTLRCTGWSYPFKPCTTTTESAGKGIGALSGGRENADGQDEGCNYLNKVGIFLVNLFKTHVRLEFEMLKGKIGEEWSWIFQQKTGSFDLPMKEGNL